MPRAKKVLVVDDHVFVVRQLARIFEGAGYVVMMAFDGDRAFDLLKSETFDFLVVDQFMPGKSGLELVDFVCSRGLDTGVVLITSSHDCPDVLERVRIYPKSRALVKPVSGSKLVEYLGAMDRQGGGAT